MKNKKSASTVAVEIVSPAPSTAVALLMKESGLSQTQAQESIALQAKRPDVVEAYRACQREETEMARKYFDLCDALRKADAHGAKLNGKEVNILLLGLGYRKQRVTEIRKAIEVDDEVWEQYRSRLIGFKAVLAIARGNGDDSGDSDGGDSADDENSQAGDKKKKDEEGDRKFPKAVAADVVKVLSDWAPSIDSEDRPFALEYVNTHGKYFLVHVFVSEETKNKK